jgi:hypothetical protein
MEIQQDIKEREEMLMSFLFLADRVAPRRAKSQMSAERDHAR